MSLDSEKDVDTEQRKQLQQDAAKEFSQQLTDAAARGEYGGELQVIDSSFTADKAK